MTLHLNYKNGTYLEQTIIYLASDSENLFYALDKSPTPIFSEPVKIPLKNLVSWEVND